ncbi:MAG: hypothetical protein QM690_02565 [Sphingobium sp.]
MRILAPLAVLLALTACGEAPEKPAARKATAALESGAAAQVAALDEQQRNGVFARAIRASGSAGCLSVAQSERTALLDGAPGWKATCDDGTAHLIEILADGTAKVTSRTH